MFKKVDPKQSWPEMEERILKFWKKNKIFKKSLKRESARKSYSFYDGPPFATGLPHYGHIVASLMKDVVPRYWTMRGYRVERKWGWDCHGLPIENIVEKELGSKNKKDIEKLGVEKFNETCREKVLSYADDWKKIIGRLGRWVDMENSYKTMDLDYMESVWQIFKELWDKGLIYEGYKPMHICPRCETTLSQSEVAEGYKDTKDLSVVAKFELLPRESASKTYILAWTTTPWTLIGNAALAINPNIKYVKIGLSNSRALCHSRESGNLDPRVKPEDDKKRNSEKDKKYNEYYILARDRLGDILKGKSYEIVEKFKGKELVGKKYRPIFDYYANSQYESALSPRESASWENGWKIYGADFVTTEEGTGVVHIAPAFGEDDMELGKRENLPFIQHIGMDGVIKKEAGEFAGLNVKPKEDYQKTDVEIIKYLARKNLLFSKEKYEHSYPHCWRCDTPLLNYAASSWFVDISKIKPKALKLAQKINWSPSHIKKGRFGHWLESAHDWSISRQRFWASVIPVWKCGKCEEKKVIGSVKELEELSGQKITDLHKHIVDKITFKCDKCGGTMRRVPDVLDCWFESGAMPYAQMHYPFENKERFERSFPADFIAEGIDQTRAWFYYLHIIATAVKNKPAFKNVIVNGIVLAEDGKKMSKRLKNYPDPMLMFNEYGADITRFYLLSSPVMSAQNLNFSEKELAELARGMFRMLWNSYYFFILYANIDGFKPKQITNRKLSGYARSGAARQATNLLDKWIISELNVLVKNVNEYMEGYELHKAARLFPGFIDNLSNWYIRRSRKRFWKSENDEDKNQAYAALHYVLAELSKAMAPFTPFVAEEIFTSLQGPINNEQNNSESGERDKTSEITSVHLEDFPKADDDLIDKELNSKMAQLREIITEGLNDRARKKIKVRQPLSKVILGQKYSKVFNEILKEGANSPFTKILFEELNVKNVEIGTPEKDVEVDTKITKDLKLEGQAREIIRFVQQMRKEAGYEVDNRIEIGYIGMSEVFQKFGKIIAKETLAEKISEGDMENFDLEKDFKIGEEKILIQIRKK